ncbi:GH36-type glycosyl hydrolase domain-containing protein [Caenimonas terrae]|uniref:GH36-type glycosyl hydrolase domain-containing protein n=1 Tax=Caenimonas terrae TaxID=696074 RepID=A0ABW0NBE8_9BURK
MPEAKLLSNGSYHLMVTAAGGGYSRWNGLALTRWREDATRDNWGSFCYLRDNDDAAVWSTTVQPALQIAGTGQATFGAGSVRFVRRDHGIELCTDIAVSPDDDVELRRVRITNLSARRRTLSATSYAEIVLADAATDSAHLAFSKLFVETAIDRELQAILATRRPSKPTDPTPWLFHLALAGDAGATPISCETDRMRFIGRGRTTADPQALQGDSALSGTSGAVLDAVAAIRVPFVLEPGASRVIDWLTGVAPSRAECMALARRQSADSGQRLLDRSASYRRATLQALRIGEDDALLFDRICPSILYAGPALRANAAGSGDAAGGQPGLWRFGISGDLAIVLLEVTELCQIELVEQLARAQAYWRAYGLNTDLVILVTPDGGGDALAGRVKEAVAAAPARSAPDRSGAIFVLDGTTLDGVGRGLLRSAARVALAGAGATLAGEIEQRCGPARAGWPEGHAPAGGSAAHADAAPPPSPQDPAVLPPTAPAAGNGWGGFTADASEYVVTATSSHMTPAPWVNVLANPQFGTLVSESGSATTWSENAHEFRLTPWSNDPVSDASTEALYIRDDDSGQLWSPTLLPAPGAGAYVARHGFGYSRFDHCEAGIDSQLSVYVAIDSPVKFSVLTLRNVSDRTRRLAVTGYLDWVLGDERGKTQMHLVTEVDPQTGALFARNPYSTDFAARVAFFDVDQASRDFCVDRAAFLGRCGTPAAPVGLASASPLPAGAGTAPDPCAALRVAFELAPGAQRELVFRLGAGQSVDQARALVQRWRPADAARGALAAVRQYWKATLGAVAVRTPDPALDALTNGWLVYQLISARLWGRTAFYQSSGAFGFRDQLQDVMALVHCQPALVREHLLRCAARQFPEGDVQHWWHPPSGKGVRTRCSDDFLWLPLATSRYVEVSGDTGVLDVPCRFLHSRPLAEDEQSNYDLPQQSDDSAGLYDHCTRAIRHALRFGQHGLPLMGAGDWNDGMNLVGAGGRGESVWLGFFLVAVLTGFAPLARRHGDAPFAALCEDEAASLRERIEASAWDGDWYLRAWFDDGTALGSATGTECQIDSIAQSWSVLSGVAGPERARRAMDSVDRRLVHRDTQLVQLLDPPFDLSRPSPGYIQGYVPGVRENGGQYTHAAVWAACAFAALGDSARAWDLCALLNPLKHAGSAAAAATYKVEPYVVAGDVYAFAPHTGRGGWSWYTGSAAWLYRLIVESLLGLQRSGNALTLRPLLPAQWPGFSMDYRFGGSTYRIDCRAVGQAGAAGVLLDGQQLQDGVIAMVDDGREHRVVVSVWRAGVTAESEPGA